MISCTPDDVNGILANLLQLNHTVAEKEKRGTAVTPPGLPGYIQNKDNYVSDDCVQFEWE